MNTFTYGGAARWYCEEVEDERRKAVPNACRYRKVKTTVAIPIVIMAPLIPIICPRWTFLTSPLKETAMTANQIENAGQIMNFSVSLNDPLGTWMPATIFW